ncbi:unknown [[Mannheimia] succiniciproducens MBEL55E]|uniref:Uncharacterized protein n=1 Tax=Mannheimia succiniciproducens (strain KCTC 0769BP / MBEL55E) TaxID=221988 RepID=Q65RG5_MANSM|nr:unknown [[Mannheimia] succiniciproducens MBEL55E]
MRSFFGLNLFCLLHLYFKNKKCGKNFRIFYRTFANSI